MVDYTKLYTRAQYDEGLRQYLLKVYTMMSICLAITAIAAYLVFSIPTLTQLMFVVALTGELQGMTTFGAVVCFAPLFISLYFSFNFARITVTNATILIWIYSALMGASLSSIGFLYTEASITKTFIICSAMFAGFSIYGYSTKKDLTSLGTLLLMGLLGLIIALFINVILRSAAVDFALSIIGVFIFTGLVAFDTQKIKDFYYSGIASNDKLGILASFTLYLDFINLFLHLLRFFGVKKERK